MWTLAGCGIFDDLTSVCSKGRDTHIPYTTIPYHTIYILYKLLLLLLRLLLLFHTEARAFNNLHYVRCEYFADGQREEKDGTRR